VWNPSPYLRINKGTQTIMRSVRNIFALLGAAIAFDAEVAWASPVHYRIDTMHTYASFEAPHIEAISFWRGKFDRTKGGEIVLDRAAKTGTVEVTIDASSVDLGLEKLNDHVKSKDFLDVASFPTATYKGAIQFTGDTPTSVKGELTLHGVTKPVTLAIRSLKCITDPMLRVERCGADVAAQIDRGDFGVNYGIPMTGSDVRLQIQVEGLVETK
jgi:polyisoprenoid-binding protein YceI